MADNQQTAERKKCIVCGAYLNIYNEGKRCFAHKKGYYINANGSSGHETSRSTRVGSPQIRSVFHQIGKKKLLRSPLNSFFNLKTDF